MSFKTFEARRVTLKEAKRSNFEEYKRQVIGYKLCEEKAMDIKQVGYYLAVYDVNKKMIGLIYVSESKNKTTANIDISIPNECMERKYGKEALHQLVKCCLERNMYDYICLNEQNSIAIAYKVERPKIFKGIDYVIDLNELRK